MLGRILQTSHSSTIFTATPIASLINGTGMRVAADCKNVKACFPVAVIYFAVVGTTSRGFSDDSWIQMCISERWEDTRINPLTPAFEFVSTSWSSTEVRSLVAETIASSFSGSSWMQLIVKKFAQSDLMLNTYLRFCLRDSNFPRHEQRTP